MTIKNRKIVIIGGAGFSGFHQDDWSDRTVRIWINQIAVHGVGGVV